MPPASRTAKKEEPSHEIGGLEDTDDNPGRETQLQFIRDMFIFSTFTGLAYADLKKLSVNDITQAKDGTWWIHIHRQKTDTLSSVRLLDIPFQIIRSTAAKESGIKCSTFSHADILLC